MANAAPSTLVVAANTGEGAGQMLDVIRLVRIVLELLVSLGPSLRTMLVQPLLTVAMLLFLYAGWHIRDEGSVRAGLRVAFIATREHRAELLRDLESAMLQGQLHQSVETDRLIEQLLRALLNRAPTAARVRLDVVHNGVTGITGTALLRYDVTNAVASPGHAVGEMVVNQPLSDWNDFLPALLAGKCQLIALREGASTVALRARLEALGAGYLMACPVIDIQGRMLGAVFITWDLRYLPPAGEDLQSLMDFSRSVGTQIASALDLGGHMLWSSNGAGAE
jgi:hypothetical protein